MVEQKQKRSNSVQEQPPIIYKKSYGILGLQLLTSALLLLRLAAVIYAAFYSSLSTNCYANELMLQAVMVFIPPWLNMLIVAIYSVLCLLIMFFCSAVSRKSSLRATLNYFIYTCDVLVQIILLPLLLFCIFPWKVALPATLAGFLVTLSLGAQYCYWTPKTPTIVDYESA